MRTNERLYQIAEQQLGYFTSRQAVDAGFLKNNHPYHVHSGNWVREGRGIYRLAQFPYQEDAELVLWSLWSRNRKDIPQGVYSHQTALRLYDLTDMAPPKLHMTVPKSFRKYNDIPPNIVLHHGALTEKEIQERQGFLVTTPLRTLQDIVHAKDIEEEFIAQAVNEAGKTGLVPVQSLQENALFQKYWIANDSRMSA